MQMAQWLDLSDKFQDNILSYIGDDDWKSSDLMLVNTRWWKNKDGTIRYQVGMIVLEPVGFLYNGLDFLEGKTFATCLRLIYRPREHDIPPDQYTYVAKLQDIHSFTPILRQRSRIMPYQIWNNGYQGQPVRYGNISGLDLSDDRNLVVDSNMWRSLEMELLDLFDSDEPLLLGTHGATFASFLLRLFFPNVTSINLSRTIWSDDASLLINFPHIVKLI